MTPILFLFCYRELTSIANLLQTEINLLQKCLLNNKNTITWRTQPNLHCNIIYIPIYIPIYFLVQSIYIYIMLGIRLCIIII